MSASRHELLAEPRPRPASAVRPRAGRGRVRWTPYLYLALPVAYLVVFQAYPIAKNFWLSLTSASVLNPSDSTYVGLQNFKDILADGTFWHALKVTSIYTCASVVASVGIGLAIATAVMRLERGRGFARAMIAVPWATPSVAAALVFTWIFDNHYGVLNHLLGVSHLGSGEAHWLDDPGHALFAVLVPTVWQLFPVCALVLLAALTAVPDELVEAARIDGAPERRIFWHVKLPEIAPSLALITLLTGIWSIRRFDTIWLLTQGGPGGATDTIVNNVYRTTFVNGNLGQGAAMGILGMALSLIVTVVYFVVSRRLAAE